MTVRERVDHQSLRRIGAAVVRAGGSEEVEAKTVADHLVDANLAGHDSHGIGLLPQYVRHLMAGLIVPNTGVRLDVDGGTVLRFEGRRGYGGRVAAEAMDIAIKRCRQLGLVAMSLAGAHHIGRIGAFGEQAIAANLISIHFVNAVDHPPVVAPFRGRFARFTTNPICIAIPGNETVPRFLLDMATTRIALGKARVAMNENRSLDVGTVIDADGQPSRDATVMFEACLSGLHPHPLGLEWAQTGYRGAHHGCSPDRADLPFPHSRAEFQRLPDDAACAAYLEKARWGDGFACTALRHGGRAVPL